MNERTNTRSCSQCGADISHRRIDARFCGVLCSNVSRGAQRGDAYPSRICALAGCGVEFTPWHSKQARSEGRVPPRGDRQRDNDHRRRARMHGARNGGSVFLTDILDRDGDLCALCGALVDLTLSYPEPLSKSVDHIVPLSRGGAHEPSNCQLAHLRCNLSKGARVA
jgi:5-methylcytosine-specific restriction endonuclease McrA